LENRVLQMRVGIDFDNTIAAYDGLFARLAAERNLFTDPPAAKRRLRNELRRRPDGESEWRRLQALAYGPRMQGAGMYDGVAAFFDVCRRRGIDVHIVSHKTRYSNFESDGTDLRQAALGWMSGNGFFDADGFALDRAQVHFTDTRQEKVQVIAALDCDHFVDDLIEVFNEPGFPAAVERILFDPAEDGSENENNNNNLVRYAHWDQIREHIFGRGH
jgi:hypothetical protein